MAHVAAEPVELPDDQDVAGAQVVQGGGQVRALGLNTGRYVGEHPHAVGGGERVALQGGVLLADRDAGVADGGHSRDCTVRPLSITDDWTLFV